MAQIPKTGMTAAPTAINTVRSSPGSKLSGGPRSVATSDASPIDEISSQAGVAFDDSLLFRDDNTEEKKNDDHAQARSLIEYPGSSETFASIFKEVNPTADEKSQAPAKTGLFSTLVVRAINIYETNSRIISGELEPRGSHLSIYL